MTLKTWKSSLLITTNYKKHNYYGYYIIIMNYKTLRVEHNYLY